MSSDPYAPPTSDLGTGAPSEVLGGRGDFEIGLAFSEAWSATWAGFPLWLGVSIVFFLAAFLVTLTVVGFFFVLPVLGWGFTGFFLNMYDRSAKLEDLFQGFSFYAEALGGMIVIFVVTFVMGVLAQSVQLAGDLMGQPVVSVIGFFVYLVLSFAVLPRFYFAYLHLVDRRLGPIESLQRAWEVTSPVKWKVMLLMLASMVVMIVGALALLIGMIPATVVVYMMWISAYRQMEGRPAPA